MSRLKKSLAGPISRRTILRGAGCTLALPWLESLHAWADSATPAAFPKRFGVVFLGLVMAAWPPRRSRRRPSGVQPVS